MAVAKGFSMTTIDNVVLDSMCGGAGGADERGRYMGRNSYESDLARRQSELETALRGGNSYMGRNSNVEDFLRRRRQLEESLRK